MADVAILIPTLGRAHRIPEILENVAETAPSARVHFIAEQSDTETVEALSGLKATIGDFGTYGKAVNAGYVGTDEPMVMTSDDDCTYGKRLVLPSADDCRYAPGWLEAALGMMKGAIRVVGTNDLHNPYVLAGEHSTHSLIDRVYIDEVGCVVDMEPGTIFYPYDHNYTDAELVETAKARGVFAPCLESVVEHIHPDFGGREPDDTWRKTRRAVSQDYNLFMARRRLWEHNPDLVYMPPRSEAA